MSKWADYLISAVNYDQNRKISKIRQHKDDGENIGNAEVVDRNILVQNLKKGIKYATIFSTNTGWKFGDWVNLIKVDGKYSIRTDSNKVETDNLKFVPEI